jgi:hypothetical protein
MLENRYMYIPGLNDYKFTFKPNYFFFSSFLSTVQHVRLNDHFARLQDHKETTE